MFGIRTVTSYLEIGNKIGSKLIPNFFLMYLLMASIEINELQ